MDGEKMGYTRIEKLRNEYKKGDRIELVEMVDAKSIPVGTRGTVQFVDDFGNVAVNWDNGSSLNFIPEVDKCKRVIE